MLVCANCGQENPEGFKFCGACAAPLAAAPSPEERKVVTVLFADITASTELAMRLDPEDLRNILEPFFRAMAEELESFGGTVEKYIGDAVVAVFGVPVAHEDDPIRALRAASAMHRRLARVNAERAAVSGVELSMRIGVNTGEVFAITEPKPGEGMVTGEAVNVAARLQGEAKPGSTLAGPRTYRDTRDAFEFVSLGPLRLKGLDLPLEAWEVLGEREGLDRRLVHHAPLIGRDSELSLLRILFDRAARERMPSLVTVIGAAGVGKTRLAQEFVALLEQESDAVRVVRGRCLPYGNGLTYWPMAEILKGDADIQDSDSADVISRKAEARLLERLGTDAPGEASRLLLSSIGMLGGGDPLSSVEPHVAKELIFRAWRAYLESLAANRPLVAVIEDLHWADPALLDLLENLLARAKGPVLFLSLARPELSDRRPSWGGGSRNVTSIVLSPLTDADSARLVGHLLETTEQLDEIHPVMDRAEGNPFFLEELVRMLIDEGSLVRRNGGWAMARPVPKSLPDTVQGVLASRIDLLPAAEKRALQDAAVVGTRTFWLGALERLETEDAARSVEGLVAKGLIQEADRSSIARDREFFFSHVLIREVAYGSVPRGRRKAAHAEVGGWIEDVTGGRAEEFAEILAHHFEQAGDSPRTARYAMLAGHRKARVFAAEDAASWYGRALDAAGKLDPTVGTPLVAEIHLSRGHAYEQLSLFGQAHEDYKKAVDVAGATADERLEAEALASLAHILRAQDRYEEGRPILDRALDRARAAGAHGLVVRTLYIAGASAYGRGEWEEALSFQREALEAAEAAGELEGEALARHGLAETQWILGSFEHALEQGLRSRDLFRELGNRQMLSHNEYVVASVLTVLGRYADAARSFGLSAEGAHEIGDRWDEGIARALRAQLSVSVGDLGAALRDLEIGIRVVDAVSAPRLQLGARVVCGLHLLGELRAFDRLQVLLAEAMDLADALRTADSLHRGSGWFRPRLLSAQGWFAIRSGDVGGGRQLFREAAELWGPARFESLTCRRLELMAWEDSGGYADDLEAAAEALCDLARAESPPFLAWGQYGLALAAVRRAAWERALEFARSALGVAEGIGELPVVWRAGTAASAALTALGRRREAEERRAAAASIVRGMSETIGDEELGDGFLRRADVTELLASTEAPRS
jgi:class 3 adenylate cyclase/tetratricopeptide (TPR) repeat protein